MIDRFKKVVKPLSVLAVIIFVACIIIKEFLDKGTIASCVSYTVSIVTIMFILYEKILWKFIPWNRPPVLKKKYHGTINYKYNDTVSMKQIEVEIRQTWLSVQIKVATDINSSYSITADIVKENNQDVLYYSYVTNPTAMSENDNPIQHGTCCMFLNRDNKAIDGKYWTSRNTTGDIHWEALSYK